MSHLHQRAQPVQVGIDPLHHLVIGITDSVFTSAKDDAGQDDQVAADMLLVDCAGLATSATAAEVNVCRVVVGSPEIGSG